MTSVQDAQEGVQGFPSIPSIVDIAYASRWNRELRRYFDQNTLVELVLHKFTDYAADAEADFCEINEKIHGGYLEDLGWFDAHGLKIIIDVATRHVVLVEEHDITILKRITVFTAHRLQIRKVLWRRYKGIMNLLRMNETKLRAACPWLGGEADVELLLFEKLQCLCGRLRIDGYTDIWILLHEGLQIWKKDVAAERRGYADLEMANVKILHAL